MIYSFNYVQMNINKINKKYVTSIYPVLNYTIIESVQLRQYLLRRITNSIKKKIHAII